VERIRVLASEKFYDKMVFSFVEISNDNDEEWIAKVLVLFRARKRNFGLIQWLDDDYTSARKTKVEHRRCFHQPASSHLHSGQQPA